MTFISAYIECVKRKDRDYDGSCIKDVFDMDPAMPIFDLIRQCHGLKLKLSRRLEYYEDRDKLESYINIMVNEERIREMVVHLKPNRKFIDLLPNNFIFNSVTELDLYDMNIRSIDGELSSILKLTPSVTKLTIALDLKQTFTAQDFVDFVFGLDKLTFLDVRFVTYVMPTRSITKFKDIVQRLSNSVGKPGLVKLNIESTWLKWKIVQSLNLDIKPFKYFRLYNSFTDREFEYSNRTMTIRDVEVPLLLAVEKFPRTKYIHITTDDLDYAERSRGDLNTIRDGLPRNKSVGFNVVTPKQVTVHS